MLGAEVAYQLVYARVPFAAESLLFSSSLAADGAGSEIFRGKFVA